MASAAQEKTDMKHLSQKLTRDLVVYDLETTGIDTSVDQIVQFHATRIFKNGNGKVVGLTFLCRPTCPINPRASEVNGFTEEKLAKEPRFAFFVKKVVDFFKDADVAGYNNKKFDDAILNRQLEENGVKNFFKDRLSFDAYEVYNFHINKKLTGAVSYYCGEQDTSGAHDASNDVGYTIQVIAKQIEKENAPPEQVVAKLEEKQKQRQQGDLDRYLIKNDKGEWVLNFSKNKGTKLAECEQGFLKWVMDKEFPQALKNIISEFIK